MFFSRNLREHRVEERTSEVSVGRTTEPLQEEDVEMAEDTPQTPKGNTIASGKPVVGHKEWKDQAFPSLEAFNAILIAKLGTAAPFFPPKIVSSLPFFKENDCSSNPWVKLGCPALSDTLFDVEDLPEEVDEIFAAVNEPQTVHFT